MQRLAQPASVLQVGGWAGIGRRGVQSWSLQSGETQYMQLGRVLVRVKNITGNSPSPTRCYSAGLAYGRVGLLVLVLVLLY